MESKLTKLAKQRSAAELKILSRKSIDWLKGKIQELRNPSGIAQTLGRESSRHTGRILLGGLYCFYYDPKTKSDLPYYDRFPLVLILERYSDGFLGLNLHYLPLQYRTAFLGKLLSYASYNENDEITRVRISYDILSASRRLKEFRPCLKKYLTGHIQSKILAIQPNEWETACVLPLQQFRKAPAATVWQESLEEMRN